MRHRRCLAAALYIFIAASSQFQAADWPQWRGPDRSNASQETGLLDRWPTHGPPLAWRASGIGIGIHAVSVANGRVFTIGYREGAEFLFALDALTGQKLWAVRTADGIEERPFMRFVNQRSPTVDGDRLYTFTGTGVLLCLSTRDGSKLWQISYPDTFGASRPSFGFTEHPLVDGDRLLCSPFGTNATVAALDKLTGRVLWQTHPHTRIVAGHAPLTLTTAGGVRQLIQFHISGLSGFAAADGRPLWNYDRTNTRVAVTFTPIVTGEIVVTPNGYGGGLNVLQINRSESGFEPIQMAHYPTRFEPTQDATARVGNHVYFAERGVLKAFDPLTGGIIWSGTQTNHAPSPALTWAENHLYVRTARGIVSLVETAPDGPIDKSWFLIPEHEPSAGVTSPVVAAGRLWLRDNNRLFCYDISRSGSKSSRSQHPHIAIGLTDRELESAANPTPAVGTGVDRAPDAVYVPTPQDIVDRMLAEAAIRPGELVVDLGSGDGRFVISAARKYGVKAIGYEIDARLVQESRETVAAEKLESLARIEHRDIFTVDLSAADVITTFLYPRLMERLIPQFDKLKPGSRIVSHHFEIPGIGPDRALVVDSKEDGNPHRILIYTTPLRKP